MDIPGRALLTYKVLYIIICVLMRYRYFFKYYMIVRHIYSKIDIRMLLHILIQIEHVRT